MTVTIGSDPEFFLKDKRTGIPRPACGLYGGEKGNAKPIPGLAEGFGYQEDNVMLEFNVPPVSSPNFFSRNIGRAIIYLKQMIVQGDPNLVMDTVCSRLFPFDALTHPKAAEFGCSPDFDAYANGAPFPGIDRTTLVEDIGQWRFAGGHIHLGYNCPGVPPFVVAAFADVFIGLRCVDRDKQGKRRELYGLPGRFRPTPYGMEYRTLSNYWLFDADEQVLIANQAYRLGTWLETTPVGIIQKAYVNTPWGDVRDCITREDGGQADYLWREIQQHMEADNA